MWTTYNQLLEARLGGVWVAIAVLEMAHASLLPSAYQHEVGTRYRMMSNQGTPT
jgi:hypothetical protein